MGEIRVSAVEGFNAARCSCVRHAFKVGVSVNDETLKLCVLGRKEFCDLVCCLNVSIPNCGAT